MRFIVLGDTHWGCRNDLPLFYKHFEVFYDSLIEYAVSNQITDIFQLGDLFDRRKFINFRTLSESKRILFDRLKDHGIRLHVLVGNHDIHMRESLEINSPSLVLKEYDNIIVYSHPQSIQVDNTAIDIIPWICEDNNDEVHKFIKDSKSDLCFGHFEIATFAMYRTDHEEDGLPVSMFEKYERVCSGHYHTRSSRHNITYVGTPYEMTWQDYNDPKGFHVFDTQTRELTFHENPNQIFVRLEYDDTQQLTDLNKYNLDGCFVKVVVVNKTDLYKFDNFMKTVYSRGCYDVKIVEDLSEFSNGEIDEDINLEDTLDVLSNYIDSIETSVDKEKVKTFMKTLYTEAVNVAVV